MATVADNPEIYTPTEDEVESAGGRSWRLANGKIVRGPKDEIEERMPQKFVGMIVRGGIHDDVTDDQYKKRILFFEIGIQTASGTESLHASLWDTENEVFRPSGAAVQLGKIFLEAAKNPEWFYEIRPSQGEGWTDDKGRPRSGTTYANLARVVRKNDKWLAEPIKHPRRDPNGPKVGYPEQWMEMEAAIKACSLYKEREKRQKSGPAKGEVTHLSELCKEVGAKGWPTPEQAPAVWLAMVAKSLKVAEVPATLPGFTEDQWGQVRLALQKMQTMPTPLKPVAEKIAEQSKVAPAAGGELDASAFGEDEDPFANL